MRAISLLPWLASACVCLAASACRQPTEVVVLHASSLRHVLADAAAELQRAQPRVRIRLEPSGSQVAVRKVTEQGLRADLVVVADAALIDEMMIPGHASWNLELAANSIVLAHLQHSRFTQEITADNWPEVLLRPGVRLGRVDPDTAPLGYHTLFVWQLAQQRSGAGGAAAGEDLARRLAAAVAPEHVGADETDLLGLLESKAVDYAFLYRSTAEDHRLKTVPLPPEIDLSRPDLAASYARAAVEVRMKQGTGGAAATATTTTLRGRPITYGATIPATARAGAQAEEILAFLLGPRGRQIQRAAGFRPLDPPIARGPVPARLRPPAGAPR